MKPRKGTPGRLRTMRWWSCGVLLSLAAAIHGCRSESFACQSDADCTIETVQGFCEPSSYCSFPDDACPSGRRYGQNAPNPISGVCVGGDGGGSSSEDTGIAPDTTPTTTLLTSAGSSSSGGSSTSGVVDESSGTTSVEPPQTNYVFVSSVLVPLGPTIVDDADALCIQLAEDAGIPGRYVAWLSTETTSAVSRLEGARGWMRPDGRPVVDRPVDLTQGNFFYPPLLDETGAELRSGEILTGTEVDGAVSNDACQSWTVFEKDDATVGRSGSTHVGWTDRGATVSCDVASARVYCFGVDLDAPLEPQPVEGRAAFVTGSTVNADDGVAGFDALCQLEGEAAGLEGTFLAVVATSMHSAVGRFDLDGPPWVNTNGVPLAPSAAAAAVAVHFDAPPAFTASGQAVDGSYWTGAQSPSGDATGSCSDWTTTSGQGRSHPTSSTEAWDFGSAASCTNLRRILCFQE
jgi:hypothetical protein